MYRLIIQLLLFSLNAEVVQRAVVWFLRVVGYVPGGNSILKSLYRVKHSSLEREVLGLKFNNPIGLAAGFDRNGDIIKPLEAIGFGFVEVGTVTCETQGGNPRPRMFRLKQDNSLVERVGNSNAGWRAVVKELRRSRKGIVVGCNISSLSDVSEADVVGSYLRTFRNLYQYSDYFTVNLAHINPTYDKAIFSSERINDIIKPLFEFRRGQSEYRPILLKVSPDLTNEQLDEIVEILINTPLDGLVAVMGSNSREGLNSSSAIIDRVGRGRVCGDYLKERALEVVKYLHKATSGNYPIIGVGGISNGDDAKAMIDAGASLVQIHSSFLHQGPRVVKRISTYLIEKIGSDE